MKEYIIKTEFDITSCQQCPLVIKHKNGSTTCSVKNGSERKYGTCLLTQLPSHGDLGDISDLYANLMADIQTSKIQTLQDVIKIINKVFEEQPTILEASK